MTSPWSEGPRHRSWASNTVLTFALLVILVIVTVVSDHFGEPPNYLVGLLGTAAGAFFAAIGSDKEKREKEIERSVRRIEDKADTLGEVAAREHPEVRDEIARPRDDAGGGG